LEPYKTASLGSYIKVAGATITSANIAAEYAKIYEAIPVVQRRYFEPLYLKCATCSQSIN
jgi:hypothetical protein